MTKTGTEEHLSKGVETLITRLREEGVKAGEQQANEILARARAESKRLLEQARQEAQQQLDDARAQAEAFKSAGEAALKTAMRDMVLEMKDTLAKGFSSDVKRLVSHQLQDPELLRAMILQIAARVREDARVDEAQQIEFVLPEKVLGLDELRNTPEAVAKGPLTEFVFGLTREMLQRGVCFSASDDRGHGMRVQLKDKDVQLDLSDEAIANLLLQHLQPRFRAILEGVVR